MHCKYLGKAFRNKDVTNWTFSSIAVSAWGKKIVIVEKVRKCYTYMYLLEELNVYQVRYLLDKFNCVSSLIAFGDKIHTLHVLL